MAHPLRRPVAREQSHDPLQHVGVVRLITPLVCDLSNQLDLIILPLQLRDDHALPYQCQQSLARSPCSRQLTCEDKVRRTGIPSQYHDL